jgi:aminoglycoside phosphotransferase (APT) family kinase protein
MSSHPRSRIYYWKCDRPAAFHGTEERPRDSARMIAQVGKALRSAFPNREINVRVAPSQGNHVTFLAGIDGADLFVRVEDGPERDDYIDVESHLIAEVRALGVPAPRIHASDSSRRDAPFAWQVMERIECPDLNQHFKQGALDLPGIAAKIGAAVATWQGIQPPGFGPFDPALLRETGKLQAFHSSYADYFHLHLDRHLRFLVDRGFLPGARTADMAAAIEEHQSLLDLNQGCLVHKDLALWNILGTGSRIAAFIDFDDAIGGDPMDDLSLLGCFHEGAFLTHALEGYHSVRPLPADHVRRFWLHLLRNMLVKAVIRVGAGYFDRTDAFFLVGAGLSGANLRDFTLARLDAALNGLLGAGDISTL